MKIECHIIQNFPPHCLNRDDTNSPKDCEFGGVRRARISSQCFKRAVRDAFERYQSFAPDVMAVRTKRIVDQVTDILVENGRDKEDAKRALVALLAQVKLRTETKEGAERTQYLLFLPKRKLAALASLANENWEALMAASAKDASAESQRETPNDGEGPETKGKAKSKPKAKAKAKGGDAADLSKEARAALDDLFRDARRTPEIALFGRMIADNADWNVEAACQVAHALSTHRVSMEFDFFTAVDDLKKDSETGSDMMGTVQFNSACFYRYAVIDHEGLLENLGGPTQRDLSVSSVKAFLHAFVHARPTGKQNSMAAHTLPSLILLTVRNGGEPLSLANAFVRPVTVKKPEDDLEQASAARLLEHYRQVERMYPDGTRKAYACRLDGTSELPGGVDEIPSVVQLIDAVCDLLKTEAKAA